MPVTYWKGMVALLLGFDYAPERCFMQQHAVPQLHLLVGVFGNRPGGHEEAALRCVNSYKQKSCRMRVNDCVATCLNVLSIILTCPL